MGHRGHRVTEAAIMLFVAKILLDFIRGFVAGFRDEWRARKIFEQKKAEYLEKLKAEYRQETLLEYRVARINMADVMDPDWIKKEVA